VTAAFGIMIVSAVVLYGVFRAKDGL